MSNLSNNKIYRKTIISNNKKNLKENLPSFSDILSIPSNPEDIFTLISPIGHGAFGTVYKAVHKKTKQVYAIKIIQYFKDDHIILSNIKHMENINFCYKTVQEETSLMRLVNSSNNIVKYFGSYFSRQTNTLWLILEFCDSGSVIDLMLAMDRTYTEVEIATIIKMVLNGLILIHEKNLIHRDIKGANILLSGEGFAKIGDFGVGVQLQEDFRKSKKGSPYWMSPQVVKNEGYGVGTDIWSLGVTCLELYNGEPPNSSLKPGEVMDKIGQCEINFDELFGDNDKKMSQSFKNFVKKCLVIDEKKRAKAKDLINDEFIVKFSKDNKLLEQLYKKHINDLDEYRKEVELYEQEMKMKQKKDYEKQMILQKQKEQQNMSIECDIQDNKEELVNRDNNIDNKDNDDEILFNKSINSLFFGNLNVNDKNDDIDSQIINNDYTNTLSNNTNNTNKSLNYLKNLTNEYNTPNELKTKKGNIFSDDDQMILKERYDNIYSNNIYTKKGNNLSSDIVNVSSGLYKKNNIINKSINIKEYSMESKITNKSCDKIRNKTQKNSEQKKNIKCRIINFNKNVIDKHKDCDNNKILNKTMEDKRILSLDINENLLLSFSNTNKTRQENRKSMNLINNIKSLSILSNSKVLQSHKKDTDIIEQYRPLKTEDNIHEKKVSIYPFDKIIPSSVKSKKLINQEIKSNKLVRTTDHSNTYDNSNSKPNSAFNTNNNNNSKISNNINTTNSIYAKKIYSQNLIIVNKDNNMTNTNKNKIPVSNKCIKSFGEINNINFEKKKSLDKNINIQKNIKNIEIKNVNSYNDKNEDINDSDDDGIINKVNNFLGTSEIENNENKENINMNNINKIKKDYNINDKSTISNISKHSYSVIDSIEFIPSVNKNNIFSYAHKKYFS